ncbi:MAG: hypothetical protein ACYC07_11665, partial [Acidithiobacillus sp.]
LLSCKQIVLDGRPTCNHRRNPQQFLTPLSYPIRPPVAVFRGAQQYASAFPEISYEEGVALMGPVRDPGANRPV